MPRKFPYRVVFIVLGTLILLPVLVIGGLIVFLESDAGERWVEARVAGLTHREVDIRGIDIQLGWPLGIALDGLRIGNPEWASTPNLVDASEVLAHVEVLPLLRGQVNVPDVRMRTANLGIERQGDQRSWRFRDGERKETRFHLSRIFMQDGEVAYRFAEQQISLDFQASGALGDAQGIAWKGSGTFKGLPAKGEGRIPYLEATLQNPTPLVAKARIGVTDLTVDGEVHPDFKRMSFKFTVAGQSLHELDRLFGVKLPDTPPYKLSGQLARNEARWDFEPLDGVIGESDIHGSVSYEKKEPRSMLQAKLNSKVLNLNDLGPLVGSGPRTGPGDRVLPQVPFHTDAWARMDANVTLDAKQVRRPKQLALETFSAHLVLENSVMRVDPLNFGYAGGKIATKVRIDGTGKPSKGRLDVDVQDLQMNKLFPGSKTMSDAMGTLYGHGKIDGTGESFGDLLATSNGTLGLAVDGGRVSALLVELMGLDFGESLLVLGTRNQQVTLRCAGGAFKIENGRVEPETFVIDTSDTVVTVRGHANLADETLALVTKPVPKDMSFGALRSPIEIDGTFRKPKIHPKAGPIVARAAAAIALGVIAPPLAALALVETGPGKDSDCGKVLADAKAAGATRAAAAPKASKGPG